MLKRFRLTSALVFSLSIILWLSLSKIFVYSLNVSNNRNVPASRQSLGEEQTGLPILLNHPLDYIIPRRRLLDDTTADINNSSNIGNSTILDVSVYSNTLIDSNKDNDTFNVETTSTVDPFPTSSSVSLNIESFSSTLEPEEAVTRVRRKRDALVNQNRLERKEDAEANEKIDRKRSPIAEKNEKVSSTDEQDEATNVRNSNDDELDDYNAVDEKSSVDTEESNENEENLEDEASQEEIASQSKDSKTKRESSDYEYVEDQDNSLDDTNDKKVGSDVRVKRDESESVKRTNENVKSEDNSMSEAKVSESGNVEASSKEEENSSGKIVANENQDSNVAVAENQDSKVAIRANKDSKVAVAESKDSKELDSKRDAFKNKIDSVKSSKESVLSMNSGKDDNVVDTKSKEEERGTRTASENKDNYEKRVEEQIKRKIDSIKEEIKREIERKRRDREIERNNAKFDELQSRDSDQEEEESSESRQKLEEGLQSKRSLENTKETAMGRRKRRSNENELARQRLEEIEGVENLKDEDYRLAGLTHESIQKRFAPVYDEVSNGEEENSKMILNKAPVKKREKVRQMFIVKNEDKQSRKKRGDNKEFRKIRAASEVKHAKKDKVQGKKRKRRIASGRRVLVPEQARVEIVEELPRDLTLDPRLRRSLPFNDGKQSQTDPLVLPAKDSNHPLVTDYNEAFGGLQSLRDNPNGALARFKRIKRVLNSSTSSQNDLKRSSV